MPSPTTPRSLAVGATHRRRLREVWRSAGWPCQDLIEAELLAAGLLERRADERGRYTVHVTDEGVKEIAASVQQNRQARNDHELLVERTATESRFRDRAIVTP